MGQFEKWLQDNLIIVAGIFVGIALLQVSPTYSFADMMHMLKSFLNVAVMMHKLYCDIHSVGTALQIVSLKCIKFSLDLQLLHQLCNSTIPKNADLSIPSVPLCLLHAHN